MCYMCVYCSIYTTNSCFFADTIQMYRHLRSRPFTCSTAPPPPQPWNPGDESDLQRNGWGMLQIRCTRNVARCLNQMWHGSVLVIMRDQYWKCKANTQYLNRYVWVQNFEQASRFMLLRSPFFCLHLSCTVKHLLFAWPYFCELMTLDLFTRLYFCDYSFLVL